jgi:hypothetical protein
VVILNKEEEFNELYLSLAVNVGTGAGKEHPESYMQHPMGFGNGMIRSVTGVDTSAPVGTLACANQIHDGIRAKEDNHHHHNAMVTIAEQQLDHIAENIKYKDADTAVDPTDDEVDEAVNVIHHSIKCQCLTPGCVIGMPFDDLQSMYDHAK